MSSADLIKELPYMEMVLHLPTYLNYFPNEVADKIISIHNYNQKNKLYYYSEGKDKEAYYERFARH